MMWELSQCETSNNSEDGWREIGADGATLRYVRVKPSEWEKWCRGQFNTDSAPETLAREDDYERYIRREMRWEPVNRWIRKFKYLFRHKQVDDDIPF